MIFRAFVFFAFLLLLPAFWWIKVSLLRRRYDAEWNVLVTQRYRCRRWFDIRSRRRCWWISIRASTRWSRSRSAWPRWSWRCRATPSCCSTPSRSCGVSTRCYCRCCATTPTSAPRSMTSHSRCSTPASKRLVRRRASSQMSPSPSVLFIPLGLLTYFLHCMLIISRGARNFSFAGRKIRNYLYPAFQTYTCPAIFRRYLKTHLF